MDIVIPSYLTPDLTIATTQTYTRNDLNDDIRSIIIVENSSKTNYFSNISSISPKIKCIKNNTSTTGSLANAEAIEIALKYCKSKYIFLSHSDSAILSPLFFDSLNHYISEGYALVGMLRDKLRIGALHSSGLLVKKSLINKVNISPKYIRKMPKIWKKLCIQDVCDSLTDYARKNALKYACFNNTYNGYSLDSKKLNYKILSLIDTTISKEGEPIFAHLGRGTPKSLGKYKTNSKNS